MQGSAVAVCSQCQPLPSRRGGLRARARSSEGQHVKDARLCSVVEIGGALGYARGSFETCGWRHAER
jgi:hypothetical protein